jgi:HPt (histidine-containing phosphotransfer) domain-containing protein
VDQDRRSSHRLSWSRTLTKLLGELEDAIAKKDAKQIKLAAHTMKGTFANLSAAQGHESALRLENLARENDLGHVSEAFDVLKDDVTTIVSEVQRILQDLPAAPTS